MMTLNLVKLVLVWGVILFLTSFAFARPNSKVCRNRNGKFPKPGTSCKGYYDCRNYVPKEMTCPDGEHFNANKQMCDWEDLYPCLEKKKDKECLRENGLFLKPGTDCKKFYRCCNGKAKVENCPGDTLFDPSKGNCEWRDLYTCIETSERKECPTRNGQFLRPGTNCRKYYNCSNGEPEEHLCPKETLFNPLTQKCESSELYTCVEKPERKECIKRNGKFLKLGTNCIKYYECSNGEPEERKCPIGTLFNPSTENCELREKYTCIETPDQNKCIRKNGKFLKPDTNCREYYKCSYGKVKTIKCEKNMLFNPSSEKCESPKTYTCIESLSTTEMVSSTVTTFETSTPPDVQKEKTSTNPSTLESTSQKTTAGNRMTYSTRDPNFERTYSEILERSTKFRTSSITSLENTEIPTTFEPKEISTPKPTTEMPTTLEPKEVSTPLSTAGITTTEEQKEISTPRITAQTTTTEEQKEISTPQPTTKTSTTKEPKEVSTPGPTTVIPTTLEQKEFSTPQPTTKTSTTEEPKEISTPGPTTVIPTTLEPKEISTPQPTTKTSTTEEPKEVSTPGPTTIIPTTLEPKEISTTTKISTPQPATTETSTSQPTTNKNLITSQTTGPEMSSTHSTDHTIFKENKEGEITDPTTFETTMKIIFSSSTVEATTSAELNFFCPEPTGHFPHPTNKYKFVACVNNIPYVFDCPHNLVYKHHLRRCDYE